MNAWPAYTHICTPNHENTGLMNEHHLADEQPAKVELLDDKIPDLTESGIDAREDVQERPETHVQKNV